MKLAMFTIGYATAFIVLALISKEDNKYYKEGFEAGKKYTRDSLIENTDSLIGCSKLGYIPDTISVKSELKNGGSYEIKGRKNKAIKR